MLITIYGINNIGKSTQAKILTKRLKKLRKKVVYIKYPFYDLMPSGPFINKIIRSKKQKISENELQMWFTLNRFQAEKKLSSYLKKNYIVIAEDYIWTGIAWGGAKGADISWLKSINSPLIKEDIAILLTGKRETDAKEKKHIHEQQENLITKCQNLLLKFAVEEKWKIIEKQNKIDDTAELIWNFLKDKLVI